MDAKEIYLETTRHFLGPVLPLLDDPSVSEILINGHETVFFERAGRLERSELAFTSSEALMAAARNIAEFVGRNIGGNDHSMDARLPDGSRVHVVVPPSARNGICISIRKFNQSTFDLNQLVKWGALSEECREFLGLCVKMHRNIVVAGGTGSGKTSLLNCALGGNPGDRTNCCHRRQFGAATASATHRLLGSSAVASRWNGPGHDSRSVRRFAADAPGSNRGRGSPSWRSRWT